MEGGLSLQVSEVKRHIAFLERIHDDALNRGSLLYLNPAMLSVAVFRYEELWLPMWVAQMNDEKGLAPPIDVAWVWHLHRLNPLGYAAFCLERFGTVLDPGASAFRLQSGDYVEDHGDADCVHTRDVWARAYPAEPFFLAAGAPAPASDSSLFDYVVSAAKLQKSFLWQVSGASFSDETFLAAAIERYDKFLRLMGACGYNKHFFVPSYDVDLSWHTHMLSSTSTYIEETRLRAGEPVDHDEFFSANERHEGSKLENGWADTKALWLEAYGSGETAPLNAEGTSWRGEPPSGWFENRHQRVWVYDEVATLALCQQLVAEIKGLAGGDPVAHERQLMLPVSLSFYEKILSMMQFGGAKQVVPREDWMETVLMPARVSAQPVLLHQVGCGSWWCGQAP